MQNFWRNWFLVFLIYPLTAFSRPETPQKVPCEDGKERATTTIDQWLSMMGLAGNQSNEQKLLLKVFSMFPEKKRAEALKRLLQKDTESKSDLLYGTSPLVELAKTFPDSKSEILRQLTESTPLRAAVLAEKIKNLPHTPQFGIAELKTFLNENPGNQAKTVKNLPSHWREGIAVLTSSSSEQGASPENPRMIPFGSHLAIAHRLHSADPELIHFREDNDYFDLYKLVEKDGIASLERQPAESCAECHGTDPRPNWRPYNFWKGAIGAFDDRIEPHSKDEKKLKDFLKLASTTPEFPYKVAELKNNFIIETEVKKIENPKERDFRMQNVVNDKFGNNFNYLNFYRLRRIIRNTPHYCYYKFAIFASLRGCKDIPSFLPPALRPQHGALADFEKKTAADKKSLEDDFKKNSGFDPNDPNYTEDIYRQGPGYFYNSEVASLRYLMEPQGIDMQFWSIDPDNHFAFSDGVHELGTLALHLQLADSELFDSFLVKNDADCERLKSRSLEALKDFRLTSDTAAPVAAPEKNPAHPK